MIALIQRVKQAKVEVAGECVGAIDQGLLVLLGVQRGDDEQGKMNLDVQQVGGSLLVVSQFTLAAETERGLRPSFSNGADPVTAERLYDYFVAACRSASLPTETGRFAADMQVFLQNDGPVTFWLEV